MTAGRRYQWVIMDEAGNYTFAEDNKECIRVFLNTLGEKAPEPVSPIDQRIAQWIEEYKTRNLMRQSFAAQEALMRDIVERQIALSKDRLTVDRQTVRNALRRR